jgi:ribosomal protein S18 acetylase RimI-like enzyme
MPDIRTIEPGDRPHLFDALRSDGTFNEDEVAVALELIDDALEKGDEDYHIRVALDQEGEVLGYICFGPTPMTESTWDLYWVVTHAKARGKGVAGQLIGRMEAELREQHATAIRVETSQKESYGAARKLYKRLGYPEAGRFEDFYRPGDDLIVYYKRL